MRRFIVLTSILAAVASFAPFSAQAVNCGAAPFNALPSDTCKQLPDLPAQGCRGPYPSNVCQALPPVLRPPNMATGSDQQVLVLNNAFNPTDTTVVAGVRILFQNLDLASHNVVYESCDTVGSARCFAFGSLALAPDAWGIGAKALNISPSNYVVGQVYHFKCTVRPDMKGTFSIA